MGVDRSDITPEGALVNAFEFCAFNILRVVFEVCRHSPATATLAPTTPRKPFLSLHTIPVVRPPLPPPLFFALPPHRSVPPPPLPPLPSPHPLLRSTLCARGWPSAPPDDGPPPGGGVGAGGRCVSPLRRVVSMVLCGPARLLSQPACSASPPVFLLGFAACCVA